MSGAEARARLKEARAFLELAQLGVASDSPAERKVSGSNSILAGIAAADAVCGLALGERSSGEDHAQAVALLERAVQPKMKSANSLKRLLTAKTPIQYGLQQISATDAADLVKWARDVIDEATQRAR